MQPSKISSPYLPNFKKLILQHISITVLSIYLYVFLEWVFFITKPSFFNSMNAVGKISILLKTGLIFVLFGVIILILVFILRWVFSRVINHAVSQYLVVILPAGVLSALALLLIDNFTYTLFNVGIVTTAGIWRGVYAALFLSVFLLTCRWLVNNVTQTFDAIYNWISYTLLSFSIILVILDSMTVRTIGKSAQISELETLPNILLLGGDGINAASTSIYEYVRETTPTIKALAERSLVMENAFPNTGNSAGSVVTILTGKNATKTRVLYPPDILRDVDSFEHLPGILRQQGYYTVELGVTHYVDAYNMNLLDGFDEVNGKIVQKTIIMRVFEPLGYDVAYFSSKLIDRITDRLFHIFYMRQMKNVFSTVVDSLNALEDDRKKIKYLLDLIEYTNQPLFVHLHLMGTHGPFFHPRQQVFSLGKQQDEAWMTDFYDDGILDYDAYIGDVIDQLNKTGKLSNTVIVIYTDHNMKYFTNQRIPLVVYFPNEEFAGRVKANAQNIDIAPTLLDYLGLPIPNWMEGTSLLNQNLDSGRLIFSAGAAHVRESNGFFILDAEKLTPPFYQFGYVGIVNCQNWYRYDLIKNNWTSGIVNGHTSRCDDDMVFSPEQIRDELLNHLRSKGFDVSILLENIDIPPAIQHP